MMWRVVRKFSQEALVRPPSPKGVPLLGTLPELIAAGGSPKLHLYVDRRHKELGPVYTEALGPVKAVFISNPKDIRRVFASEGKFPVHLLPESWVLYNKLYGCSRGLFFMDGEEWLKHRHIMNKIMLKSQLSEKQLAGYKSATSDVVDEWTQNMDKPVNDVVNHMYKLSISYVLASLMGTSYPDHRHSLRQNVDQLAKVIHLIFHESSKLNLIPAKLAATLRLPVWRRFVDAVQISLSSAKQLVDQLIPLASEDGMLSQLKHENVPHEKIVKIAVDLILAGADTTPYTMVWALYLLARNSDVQDEVAEKVRSTPVEEWTNHPLLRAVARETLRLYPAAPFIARILPVDVELSGFTVSAGETILMSLHTSGRSEQNFPDAGRFWPARWLRNESGRYQGVSEATASLPFAMGGRACIGRKVAETLMSLTLAQILSQFRVNVQKEIEMVLMLVPVPAEPVTLFLSKRVS